MRKRPLHHIRDIAWVAFCWAPRRLFGDPRLLAGLLGVVVLALGTVYLVRATAPGPASIGGGGGAAHANDGDPDTDTDPLPSSAEPVIDAEALAAQLDAYLLASPDVHVSVYVRVGDEVFDYGGAQRYDTASIVKVDILATLLYRAELRGVPLTPDQAELATAMITESDNDATNELYGDIGGPDGLDEANAVFGLTETETDWDWGLVRTSAKDQVRLWRAVMNPGILLPQDVEWLRRLTASVVGWQSWGVSAAAADGATVRVKNGWDTRVSLHDRWVVNSVGLIEPPAGPDVYLAVLSDNHADYDAAVDLVEGVAAMVGAELNEG